MHCTGGNDDSNYKRLQWRAMRRVSKSANESPRKVQESSFESMSIVSLIVIAQPLKPLDVKVGCRRGMCVFSAWHTPEGA